MALARGARLGPYEILAPLGAGGMGEVYRARDPRLDRDVAIKVLSAATASDTVAIARLEREAKAVAALSHPNILAMFDFGNENGISYAVTELLNGETLRAKLAGGPISVPEAVGYGLQIARGLSAAHERGIIHRDLKPENIFVTENGVLKILDFGLAKRTESVDPGMETSAPTDSGFTTPGTVMGTLGYMSPEQVRGVAVDHRSDLFSLGAILYELLSGQRAFQRDTAGDTMAAILKEEPSELSTSGRKVPIALDHVVRHCLEKDRKNRFQSAKDIAFALSEASGPSTVRGERFPGVGLLKPARFVALILLVLLAGTAILVWRRPHAPAPRGAVKRVAVLPFENLGSGEDDYFADGIADAVRGKLTSLKGIEVIARASSITYKKTTKSQKDIAEELAAPYLLTATVRWQKSGGARRVQVTPELVEVTNSGAPASKWQQPFDANLTDIFQVQSEIAAKVARELGIALEGPELEQLSRRPTENLAAYGAFLKGEEAEISSMRKAQEYYEQAVALDPRFARAWAKLSESSSLLYWLSTPTPELAERARQAAEKAAALGPDLVEGHLALGSYQEYVLNDVVKASDEYGRAFRIGPPTAELLGAGNRLEKRLGHWDSALELARQQERLDPRSIQTKLGLAITLMCMRRPRDAREILDRALTIAPDAIAVIQIKAETFLAEGDLAQARDLLKSSRRKDADSTELVAGLASFDDLVWVLDESQMELLLRLTPTAFDGNRAAWAMCLTQAHALRNDRGKLREYAEEARKAYQEQLLAAPNDPQRHAGLGLALAYLGRKDEAIREGERAVSLQPVSKNAFFGPYYEHQLVRILSLVGEPEKALDHLERLMKFPYGVTRDWLKIDPNFDPLRKNPRFQRLIAKT